MTYKERPFIQSNVTPEMADQAARYSLALITLLNNGGEIEKIIGDARRKLEKEKPLSFADKLVFACLKEAQGELFPDIPRTALTQGYLVDTSPQNTQLIYQTTKDVLLVFTASVAGNTDSGGKT